MFSNIIFFYLALSLFYFRSKFKKTLNFNAKFSDVYIFKNENKNKHGDGGYRTKANKIIRKYRYLWLDKHNPDKSKKSNLINVL